MINYVSRPVGNPFIPFGPFHSHPLGQILLTVKLLMELIEAGSPVLAHQIDQGFVGTGDVSGKILSMLGGLFQTPRAIEDKVDIVGCLDLFPVETGSDHIDQGGILIKTVFFLILFVQGKGLRIDRIKGEPSLQELSKLTHRSELSEMVTGSILFASLS
ncbi:MAG: hypothetical protein IH613_07705 [Desulfuromonadales bacterium]|nr:hypothetical protein [Desulfuromonadales bacterium]